MATDRYPTRNINMPIPQALLDANRARLTVKQPGSPPQQPSHGDGSRRPIGQNEWIDDRRIELDGPASPSEDEPPELPSARETPPATYDPTKVYQITLGKGVVFAGRMLAPGKTYQMIGDACTEVSAAIIDAVVLGDVPVNPDIAPSQQPNRDQG